MKRVWVSSYSPGVPADIDPTTFPSLDALLLESCARFAEYPAFSNHGSTLSYQEVERLSRTFAAFLQEVAGVRKGDRVAIMLPNTLQYPVALLGVLRAGCVVVNVNPLYTPRELSHQLSDSGATVIVILRHLLPTLTTVLDQTPVKTVVTTELGDLFSWPRRLFFNAAARWLYRHVPVPQMPNAIGFRTALQRGAQYPLQPVPLNTTDIALLQYTGGTTGVAKGAVLTHGNLLANVEQATAWVRPVIHSGKEVVVTALPLYHIFSLTANALTFWRAGAHNILITNPRDLRGFVRTLQKTPFSVITGVNTLFRALLDTPTFEQVDFSALKISLGGGAAIQKPVAERWQQVTGCPLLEAYGLSEASPAVCVNPLTLKAYSGTIGVPLPSTEISLRNTEGQPVPLGMPGELCVRGPQVMRGYWQRPEETAEVFTHDGFLRTGDVAVMDTQGFVRIVDRQKDVILVSGFNVYPNEIEAVAVTHPDIVDAAAVGVPHPASGEAVRLFVVRRHPELTELTVLAHCRAHLTGYKIPQQVVFRDQLPKSPVGKVLRRALREDD